MIARTLLFVPGQRENMLAKAPDTGADVLVLDLEDAVPAAEKPAAREAARAHVERLAARRPVFVRLNGVHSGLTRDDLMAVVAPGLSGVVVPKAQAAQDLRDLDVLLREAEMANGVRPGAVRTIPIIESTRGLLRCEDIARASDRIVGLSIGAEDYTAELGVERNIEGTALAYIRYVVAQVATAYGLLAIDTPYSDVRDIDGLVAETEFVRAVGFKGKYVLHPDQVEPVNRVFTPSPEKVAEARRIVEAYGAAVSRGVGAASLDGRMIDGPIAERAKRTIELADAIARRETS